MPETFPAATWERISLLAAGKQHFAPSQDPADHSSPKQSCFLALNGNIRTNGMRKKLGEVSLQEKLPFSKSISCCWRAVGGECSQGSSWISADDLNPVPGVEGGLALGHPSGFFQQQLTRGLLRLRSEVGF